MVKENGDGEGRMAVVRKRHVCLKLKFRRNWSELRQPNINREEAGGGAGVAQQAAPAVRRTMGGIWMGGGRYLDGDERQLSEERWAAP
jgi:hypothetical protein